MRFFPLKHRRALHVAVVLVGASVGFGSWAYQATEASKVYTASFIGRESCAKCHADQMHKWTGSHHDLAMDYATPETVVDPAAFDGREFTLHGVTSKFFREGDKFFVTTDGDDGKLATFEIKYVFGVDPLQQYMVEFPEKNKIRTQEGHEIELPGGRVQVLSIAWDTAERRWFHLHPKRNYPPGDYLHWTGGGFNWNYMCAECHSTDLRKNYDLATNTYHTEWKEIDVGCEACHGPASEHVARAESMLGFNDPRHFHSYALNRMKDPSNKPQIETCAQCHARRRIVHGDYRPGRNFYDFYEAETLAGNEYFADGQIREELYEYGSFLQSRMFRENVRCSDCHDPHSLEPKFAGNALCTQCHIQAKYDTPTHHHHAFDSSGAKCADCHMPRRTYMEVDPRRDHSIRVPRPDLTKKFLDAGATHPPPNACQMCHDAAAKENPKLALSLDQAVDKVAEWFPDSAYRKRTHFGETLEAGKRHDPHAAAGLIDLARNKPTVTADEKAAAVGPVVRASAVSLLAGYGDAASQRSVDAALKDAEPLVRSAAIGTFRNLSAAELLAQKPKLVAALRDPVRNVRTEAALALTKLPRAELSDKEQELFWQVFREWEAGYLFVADNAGANFALGLGYDRLLRSSDISNEAAVVLANETWGKKSEEALRRALALDPMQLDAVMQLANLFDYLNRDAEAEELYRRALRDGTAHPDVGTPIFLSEVETQLGWLLLRDRAGTRAVEAEQHLAQALRHSAQHPTARQYHGLALLAVGRLTDGETELAQSCTQDAHWAEVMHEFAGQAIRARKIDEARIILRTLMKLMPQAEQFYRDIPAMLRHIGGL